MRLLDSGTKPVISFGLGIVTRPKAYEVYEIMEVVPTHYRPEKELIDEKPLGSYKSFTVDMRISALRRIRPTAGTVISSMRGSGLIWSFVSLAHFVIEDFVIEDNEGGPGSR